MQAQAAEAGVSVVHDIEEQAEEVEEQLVDVEIEETDAVEAAEKAT